jgi:hypothetical protein
MVPSFRYSALLFLLMTVSFFLHWKALEILSRTVDLGHLLPFYVMNYIMGVAIVSALIFLSKNKGEILGFVFMAGSLVKFAVFFMVFYPELHENDASKKATFILFFIPYILSVITEVWYLIRFLNKQS